MERLDQSKEQEIEHLHDLVYKSININFKADLLLEFVEENGKAPKCGEIFKGVLIGYLWNVIKKGIHSHLYENILIFNDILKKDYNKTQLEYQLRIDKVKGHTLIEFVKVYKREPKAKETYKNINVGSVWAHVKEKKYSNIYSTLLIDNEFLKAKYEEAQLKKEKNLALEEKKLLLLEFAKKYDRAPDHKEVYSNFNIGYFWETFLHQKPREKFYESILYENSTLKNDFERIQSLKEEKSKIVKITTLDKCKELIRYVEEFDEIPSHSKVSNSIKIGSLWKDVKIEKYLKYQQLIFQNEKLKDEYIKCQEKKIQTKSPEEKSSIAQIEPTP